MFQARRLLDGRPTKYLSRRQMKVKLREQMVMKRISAKEWTIWVSERKGDEL